MSKRLAIYHISEDFEIDDLSDPAWDRAPEVLIENYWSGDTATADRHFGVKGIWSGTALYVRFNANQNEPLVVNDDPDLTKKTIGLWNRDVCEIFIAPDRLDPNRYFEFEVAPTGEWVDLAIVANKNQRESDLDYASGMQSAARIEKDRVVMAIKIPWKAFGSRPRAADVWLGNLFRCVGKEPTRGYLAWQPTNTPKPNFHITEAFGEFQFSK